MIDGVPDDAGRIRLFRRRSRRKQEHSERNKESDIHGLFDSKKSRFISVSQPQWHGHDRKALAQSTPSPAIAKYVLIAMVREFARARLKVEEEAR